MSQKYCCNKTLADVLADWWQVYLKHFIANIFFTSYFLKIYTIWTNKPNNRINMLFLQGFLELTQLKELKLASDKLKLKRSLPINGTEAMPEKKLFKVQRNINVY